MLLYLSTFGSLWICIEHRAMSTLGGRDVWYFTIYTDDPVWLWGRWRIWCVIGQIQSYSQTEPMMHSVQELLLIIHPWVYCRWLINCQSSDKDQAHDSLWPLSVFSGCFQWTWFNLWTFMWCRFICQTFPFSCTLRDQTSPQ